MQHEEGGEREDRFDKDEKGLRNGRKIGKGKKRWRRGCHIQLTELSTKLVRSTST